MITRGRSRPSRYGEFAVDPETVFIILQMNQLNSQLLNDLRLYVNCKPGARTSIRPSLSHWFKQSGVQVCYLAHLCDIIYMSRK